MIVSVKLSTVILSISFLSFAINGVFAEIFTYDGIEIRIYNDRPVRPNFFVEGEPTHTNVEINNTGTETRVFVANYTFTSIDRPEQSFSFLSNQSLPPSSYACLCPLLLLPEGTWRNEVIVNQIMPEEKQVGSFIGSFYVKGAEIGVIERQAKAEEENAFWSQLNVVISPLAAVGAAVGGAYFTYRYGHKIEERRERAENQKEEQFANRIRTLVRHELQTYRTFLNNILESATVWSKEMYIHDRAVIDTARNWHQIAHLIAYTPKQYLGLSIEVKAKIFQAESLQKIEDAYERFEVFIRHQLTSDYDDEQQDGREHRRIHFDEENAQDTLRLVNSALESIT